MKPFRIDSFEEFIKVREMLFTDEFKQVPIRFYWKESVIQELFRTCDDEGKPKTLLDALNQVNLNNHVQVMIQGLLLDVQIQLSWLYFHASYPDTFLHLVVYEK